MSQQSTQCPAFPSLGLVPLSQWWKPIQVIELCEANFWLKCCDRLCTNTRWGVNMKISQRKMIQAILTVLYLSLPVSQGQGRHHITIILTFIYNNLIDILCTVCYVMLCLVLGLVDYCVMMMSLAPSCHHRHNHGGKWGDHDGVVSWIKVIKILRTYNLQHSLRVGKLSSLSEGAAPHKLIYNF